MCLVTRKIAILINSQLIIQSSSLFFQTNILVHDDFHYLLPNSDVVSGRAGWPLAHLDFGSLGNPIPNKGEDYALPHYCLPTLI